MFKNLISLAKEKHKINVTNAFYIREDISITFSFETKQRNNLCSELSLKLEIQYILIKEK